MYCNKMYWGHGAYGVEAASQLYFGKPVEGPHARRGRDDRGHPSRATRGRARTSTMPAARTRRNYALDRMAGEGFITAEEAAAAKARPIVTRGQPSRRRRSRRTSSRPSARSSRSSTAPRPSTKAASPSGPASIPALQRAANRALDDGCGSSTRVAAYRKPTQNVIAEKKSIDTLPASALDSRLVERRHRAGARDEPRGLDDPRPRRDAGRARSRQPATRGRSARRRPNSSRRATSSRSGSARPGPEGATLHGDARAAAGARRRGARDRQPHRPDPGDGRRHRASSAPSSTARRRRCARSARSSSRSSTRRRSTAATPPISQLDRRAGELRRGRRASRRYEPKNYDREYHGAVTLRTRARRIAQRPDDQADGGAGPGAGHPVRRVTSASPTPLPDYLSVAIGVGGRHAARDDVGLLRVPESGRADGRRCCCSK